jgi:hypothetical protein
VNCKNIASGNRVCVLLKRPITTSAEAGVVAVAGTTVTLTQAVSGAWNVPTVSKMRDRWWRNRLGTEVPSALQWGYTLSDVSAVELNSAFKQYQQNYRRSGTGTSSTVSTYMPSSSEKVHLQNNHKEHNVARIASTALHSQQMPSVLQRNVKWKLSERGV